MIWMMSLVLVAGTAHADGSLLDDAFAATLCTGWNETAMPVLLGRDGSGWIDSAGSTGRQIIVVNRRDCSSWHEVQLVIEADSAGNASCIRGGAWKGESFQWKFEPTTAQWADFTDGFGVMDMPGIMPGFVGPYGTAAANISSFEVFFALAGKTALDQGVDWTCDGADPAKVQKQIDKIDREDMGRILR